MRSFALALAVFALILALAALAHAQPPGYSGREVVSAGDGPIIVDTVWASGRAGRSARVEAALDGSTRTLYEGATVRTAVAARPNALAVVAFHGGDAAFARVLIAPIAGARIGAPVVVELDRASALARSGALRPAAAVVAGTPDGFVVVLQEQEPDTTRDVVTTLTRLSVDGLILEATHVVAIPWQLAAIAVRPGGGYELGVVYGAGSSPDAPQARACVVSLSATGQPTEHPWWASASDAYGLVRLAIVEEVIVVAWLGLDGTTIYATRWATDGHWGSAPTTIEVLGVIGPDESFALDTSAGVVTLVSR